MANVTITQLPAVSSATDTDVFPLVASNITSQITAANLKTYLTSGNTTYGNISATGNITAGGNLAGTYVLGNISFATGGYGDSNVLSVLGALSANIIPSSNNVITLGDPTHQFKDLYLSNSTLYFDSVPMTVNGTTLQVNGENVVTTTNGNTVTEGNITVSGNIVAANVIGNVAVSNVVGLGNIATVDLNNNGATYLAGNGMWTALTTSYGNSNVADYLASGVNMLGVNTQGEITAAQFNGNGVLLTDLTGSNVSGQVGNALVAGTVYTNAQPNITSVGTLSSLTVTGNIVSNNAIATNEISAAGNIVSTGYFIGDGSQLTGIAPTVQVYEFANVISTGGYYEATWLSDYVSGTLANVSATVTTTPTNIASFVTEPGYPNITVIPSGTILTRIESTKDAGPQGYYIYAEIYKRTSGGVETLIATSDHSSTITQNATVQQNLIAYITTPVALASTDSIVTKIFAVMMSGSATVTLSFDDNTGSGLQLPALPASAANFVPYTGAVADLNLGAQNLSTTGTVSSAHLVGEASNLSNIAGSNVNGFVANATQADTANVASVAYSIDLANVTGAGNVAAINLNNSATAYLSGAGTWDTPSGTYSNSNVADYLASGVNTANVITLGNIQASTFIGNGSLLSGMYGDPDVELLLGNVPTNIVPAAPDIYTLGNISNPFDVVYTTTVNLGVTGINLNGNSITTLGNTIYIDPLNDGSPLGNVVILGNLQVAGNLTYADVTYATTANLLWIAANTAATPALASGAGLGVGANAAYASFVFNSVSNTWDASLPVTAANFIGDGSKLSGINGANVSLVALATQANNANSASTVTTNAQPNITSVGTLSSLTVTGNTTTSTLTVGSIITSGVSGNISGVNNYLGNAVSVTGNITSSSGVFTGNGAGLTNVTALTATKAATVTTNAQPNVTSVGTLTSLNSAGNIAINGSGELLIATNNNHGGANYAGIMTMTNTNVGSTNSNKFIRLNEVGSIEVVNSSYSAVITTLTDSGNLSTAGSVTANQSNAFVAGSAASSAVSLQLPFDSAIRNYYNGDNSIYYDVSVGGTTNGHHIFRGTSSYTQYAKIDNNGIQSITTYAGKTSFNVGLDTVVTVDNLKFRISNQGGIFPQCGPLSGSVDVCYSGIGYINGAASNPSTAFNTGFIISSGTWLSLFSLYGMNSRGDSIVFHITDKNSNKIYRTTYLVTNNSSNTTGYNIIVERLI